jgi:hypothetical protein
MLEGAQPLCPLVGMPSMQRAWSAKPGETVILRSSERLSSDAWRLNTELLRDLTARTGVHFVLLDPSLEVVSPDGAHV